MRGKNLTLSESDPVDRGMRPENVSRLERKITTPPDSLSPSWFVVVILRSTPRSDKEAVRADVEGAPDWEGGIVSEPDVTNSLKVQALKNDVYNSLRPVLDDDEWHLASCTYGQRELESLIRLALVVLDAGGIVPELVSSSVGERFRREVSLAMRKAALIRDHLLSIKGPMTPRDGKAMSELERLYLGVGIQVLISDGWDDHPSRQLARAAELRDE
ncbi:MAG TPA: hypothetical protein VMV09_09595, partial [Candidatus Saccharimonadales bacterium]|nr:hypothetical protein [Candidatus Saccharimonadales bacterium]